MRDDTRQLSRLLASGVLAVGFLGGCQGTSRRVVNGSTTSASEPALKADIQPGTTVVEPDTSATVGTGAASTRMVSALDRHPLLRKPKEYFNNTNSNKAVKTAAAAVVGVPAGIVGELKQIVVGTPSAATNTAPSTLVY